MNEELTHIIEFTLGDPSGDGHGHTSEWMIKTNHSGKEMDEAFAKFNKEYDVDAKHEIASDYEESCIKGHALEVFEELGWIKQDDINEYDEYVIDSEYEFVDLMMRIVVHYIPDFKYEPYSVPNTEQCFTMEGAGYGLFFC